MASFRAAQTPYLIPNDISKWSFKPRSSLLPSLSFPFSFSSDILCCSYFSFPCSCIFILLLPHSPPHSPFPYSSLLLPSFASVSSSIFCVPSVIFLCCFLLFPPVFLIQLFSCHPPISPFPLSFPNLPSSIQSPVHPSSSPSAGPPSP